MANIFYPLVRARIRPKVFCPISKNEDNSTIHSDSGPESRGNDYTCKFFKIKFYLKQTKINYLFFLNLAFSSLGVYNNQQTSFFIL